MTTAITPFTAPVVYPRMPVGEERVSDETLSQPYEGFAWRVADLEDLNHNGEFT